MRALLRTFAVLSALVLLGCPLEPPPGPPPAPKASPAAEETAKAPAKRTEPLPKPAADAPVYEVVCGCSVKEVGKCSEWAVVDGKHVQLSDLGMGSMPFCGKTGLKARIAGEVKDGKLEAIGFELVK